MSETRTTDVFTFGETMVLLSPLQDGPLRHVTHFQKAIGGAESNVAIGLARLGHRAVWYSRLGRDELGLYIRNALRGEGIDTTHVHFDETRPTGLFLKERFPEQESHVYYYRSGSAASALSPDDLQSSWFREARFVHMTGITPALSPSCLETARKAVQLAKQAGCQTVFDPNIRRKLWSEELARETLLPIAIQADIVLPGLDEGQLLTGATSPAAIAEFFLTRGARLVVVKLGADGAYFATPDNAGLVPAHPVARIVDPTGAGDAFAAGLLSGLLRESPIVAAVELAARVAARVLTTPGDTEGLPTDTEMFGTEPVTR